MASTTPTITLISTIADNTSDDDNNSVDLSGNITYDNYDLDNEDGRSYNVTTPGGTVHDIDYDFTVRVTVLYVQIVLGTVGGVLVMVWILYNRRLRTRVNALILNLCVADLMVMYLGCVTQLVWEYTDREWLAGDFMCRLMKFFMIFANCSSTNMLVVIAIDRHQAIRSPLREPFAVSARFAIALSCLVFVLVNIYPHIFLPPSPLFLPLFFPLLPLFLLFLYLLFPSSSHLPLSLIHI